MWVLMKRRRNYRSAKNLDDKRELEDKLKREKESKDKSRKRTRGPYRKASLRGRQKKM